MTFDCLSEAQEFNIYSWEVGFGIRYDRSRRNSERTKTIQDIVCICSVRPAHSCYFVPLPNFFECLGVFFCPLAKLLRVQIIFCSYLILL